jgi:hypothetical protein
MSSARNPGRFAGLRYVIISIVAGFAWVILSLTSTRLPEYQDRVNSYLQLPSSGRLCSCCGG